MVEHDFFSANSEILRRAKTKNMISNKSIVANDDFTSNCAWLLSTNTFDNISAGNQMSLSNQSDMWVCVFQLSLPFVFCFFFLRQLVYQSHPFIFCLQCLYLLCMPRLKWMFIYRCFGLDVNTINAKDHIVWNFLFHLHNM